MGMKQNSAADADQKQLNADTITQLQNDLENTPKGADIPKDEAGMDALVNAVGADTPAPAVNTPQPISTPTPSVNPQMAAQVLAPTGAGAGRGGQGGPTAAQFQSIPTPSVNPQMAAQVLAQTGGATGSWDAPTQPPASQPPAIPVVQQPVVATPSPSAMGNATAINTPAMPNATAPQMPPLLNRTEAQANATGGSLPPSQAQQMGYIAKLSQDGPMGQAIANAQMQNMSTTNGRYTTEVKPDIVNGGFVKVTTDTRTGQTQVSPISMAGNGGAYEIVSAADGTRMKVFKNGSPSVPVTDSNGVPVKDPTIINQNTSNKNEVFGKIEAAKNTLGALNSTNTRLDRIDQLANKWAGTGGMFQRRFPVVLQDPEYQEYESLLGQNTFGTLGDAINTGEGTAIKTNRAEYEQITKAGTPTPEHSAATVHNLTAQARTHLKAIGSATNGYLDAVSPQTAAPSAAPPGQTQNTGQPVNVPGRGQTTTASSFGF
jgi:hypothetical protein